MKPLRNFRFILGTETHTFTAIGRCPRSGRMGVAVTTGEVATGGRVPDHTQNIWKAPC